MAKRKVTKSDQLAHEAYDNNDRNTLSIDIYQNHDLDQPVSSLSIAERALKRIKDNLRENLRINQKSKQLVTHSQSIAQKIQW